jgi:hypothetical protein
MHLPIASGHQADQERKRQAVFQAHTPHHHEMELNRMGDAAPRATKFQVELSGDLETVHGICSKCPKEISLEENFAGWVPTSSAVTTVILVAHQDMEADAAALLLALVLKGIPEQPARGNTSLHMRVTVGSDVKLSRIEEHFRPIADCPWAEIEFRSALEASIPVETTNMSDLIKRAIAQSRQGD